VSEQNAVFTAKLAVSKSTGRHARRDAEPREQSDHLATGAQTPAEYWASRTLWMLITVTSLWDITVTFDQHFALPRRLVYAALLH
jgi:hypothetical protein